MKTWAIDQSCSYCAMSWEQNILGLSSGGISTSGRHAPSVFSTSAQELWPLSWWRSGVLNKQRCCGFCPNWILKENLFDLWVSLSAVSTSVFISLILFTFQSFRVDHVRFDFYRTSAVNWCCFLCIFFYRKHLYFLKVLWGHFKLFLIEIHSFQDFSWN